MTETDQKNRLSKRLSLIIPAFNEADRIGKTLDKVFAYLDKQDYASEVIVVDDGSNDTTRDIVEAYIMKRAEDVGANARVSLQVFTLDINRGKGYTVNYGMLHMAKGAYRVFYDADAATPIDEVENLWPAFANGADVVIGSRSLPESDVVIFQPWYRVFMGRTFNILLHLMRLSRYQDTQCGFKGFTAAATEAIFKRQTLWGFSFDVELLFIAKQLGYVITEIPIRWRDDPCSKVNPVRDAGQMFLDIVRIRVNDLLGRYH